MLEVCEQLVKDIGGPLGTPTTTTTTTKTLHSHLYNCPYGSYFPGSYNQTLIFWWQPPEGLVGMPSLMSLPTKDAHIHYYRAPFPPLQRPQLQLMAPPELYATSLATLKLYVVCVVHVNGVWWV